MVPLNLGLVVLSILETLSPIPRVKQTSPRVRSCYWALSVLPCARAPSDFDAAARSVRAPLIHSFSTTVAFLISSVLINIWRRKEWWSSNKPLIMGFSAQITTFLLVAGFTVITTRNIEDILMDEDSQHPNSVYSRFSKHTNNNIKIFYQTGVSLHLHFYSVIESILSLFSLLASRLSKHLFIQLFLLLRMFFSY